MSFFINFDAEEESVGTSAEESVSDEEDREPSQQNAEIQNAEISVLGELQKIKVALDDLGKRLGKLERKMDAKEGVHVCNSSGSSSTTTTPKRHRSKEVPAQVRVS